MIMVKKESTSINNSIKTALPTDVTHCDLNYESMLRNIRTSGLWGREENIILLSAKSGKTENTFYSLWSKQISK